MSQEERDKLEWLKRAKDGVISQREAARRMGVSDRWVRKLLKRMKRQGDCVVVHGLRGRASNRRIATKVQAQAIELLKQPDWHDFGPTFASEQLAKRHGIELSDETLRGWMIEAGLWKPGARRIEQVHCWRPRRSAFGELVQWDTSEHDWLEGRGPVRYLVRLIDDATSWSWGRFVERDATPFNMAVLWEYLEKNGRMVDVYTDRDSMFAVAPRAGESEAERAAADRLTQMGRGLRELGIGWIAAYSPQAKGRIERSFLTAQDRLVKDLRLAKVSTMEAANTFLEKEYWPEWNARFARPIADFPNQHRALTPTLELAAILCHVESRVIGNDYTFSFAGRRYQIARQDAQAGMRHQRLRLELRLNGELHARYQQRYLNIPECGARVAAPAPALPKPVRKDHNAGGKSSWMQGFFDRPSPPLWKAIGE
ncbi:MAG TPA: ISNCY family transposase [Terriglobales bacterium]